MSKYTELRELEARATAGEWSSAWDDECSIDDDDWPLIHAGGNPIISGMWYDGPRAACTREDAALICATRNALPELLDELEMVQKLLGRWQADADDEQSTQDERAVFAHCVAGLTRALGLWEEST